MSTRKVVVTGIGAITAAGFNDKEMWNTLIAGHTGIRPIQSLDVSECKTKIGAEVDTARMTAALQEWNLKPDDRTVALGLLASAHALEQAGLITRTPPYTPQNVGVIFGTGIGSAFSMNTAYTAFLQKGMKGPRPTTVPRAMANALTSQISLTFRLTGPNYVVICACSSATTAIGIAFRMIRDGYADRVLCGGADASFEPATFASWNNLGVMSRNPDPEKALRPFDSARDGTLLGEGSAALVLESLECAQQRKAPIRAEIAGFGEASDAEHITHPNPIGQAAAVQAALQSARITPADIAFINAHGTGTKANDECESETIRTVFGPLTDTIPVVANKSCFGHLLGAAGAAETVASILSLEHRLLPPNLNLDNPDPKCNLCFVRSSPQPVSREYALKNSFGFGGNNSVLVIRRWQ